MRQVYLLTESSFGRSLDRFLRFTLGVTPCLKSLPRIPEESDDVWVSSTFAKIYEDLAENMTNESNFAASAMVVIEVNDPAITSFSDLNPVSTCQGWAAVVAMLILALPEIHWVLLTPYGELADGDPNYLNKVNTFTLGDKGLQFLKASDMGYCPRFDPSGLRELILRNVSRTEDCFVRRRSGEVVSVDDEQDYALLTGYAAYRHGFRAHVITTATLLDEVLGPASTCAPVASFEDIYLSFGDKPQLGWDSVTPPNSGSRRVHLSSLEQRDLRFSGFLKAKDRVWITLGHPPKTETFDRVAENKAYELKLHALTARG